MPDPEQLPRPWLASYPPGVPPTYDYPVVPVTRFLDDAARDFPDVAATWFQGATICYSDLLEQVDRLAAGLGDLGVEKATRVAVALPNLPATPIVFFAALRRAAVVVPLDPFAHPNELGRRLHDSGAEVFVGPSSTLSRLAVVRDRLAGLRAVIATDVVDWLPFPRGKLATLSGRLRRRFGLAADRGVFSLTDVVRSSDPIAKQAATAPGDLAVIAYDHPTESTSRGVMLTHANLVAASFQARLWIPDTQAGKERVLMAGSLPDLHALIVGLLNGVLSAATMLLVPRFEVRRSLKVIAKQQPTLVPGDPTMFRLLVEDPRAARTDLRSIRVGLSGGGPLPIDLSRRFRAVSGGRLRASYGLAETSSLTHANPIYGRAVEGAIGLPVTDTLAAIVDSEDPTELLPPGQAGQLIVSGPQVMPGYWNRPRDTARVLRAGWLLTGDRQRGARRTRRGRWGRSRGRPQGARAAAYRRGWPGRPARPRPDR